jgi:hypothetical protein
MTKSLTSAVALIATLAMPYLAEAACSQTTSIENKSGITLRFTELKSSSSAPFFKSQWTGSRVIASGATGKISWTSDLNCTDALGTENHWDIKLFRKDGNVHYCGHLTAGQDVSVNTPDLCFPK